MDPITYNGSRGPGVIERIEAAGISIVCVGLPNWQASNGVAALAMIASYTPAMDAVYVKRRIDEKAAEIRARARGATATEEMASWATKLDEARAYTIEPTDPTSARNLGVPTLYREAQARGVTVLAIRERVLAKAEGFLNAEADIGGYAGSRKDACDAVLVNPALTTDAQRFQALQQILRLVVWQEQGWPA